MNTLASRLKSARLAKGISQQELAELAGVSQSLITKIESGNATESRKAGQIAKVLDVSAYWLATGKDDKHGVQEPSNVAYAPYPPGCVPIISWVSAANWSEAIEDYNGETIPVSCPVSHRTFALRVNGDSMEPEFLHNDIIVVEPEMEALHRNFVIAKSGGDATFKQLVKDGPDWYLKPLNDRYPLRPLGDSQIIGVVREKIKIYC